MFTTKLPFLLADFFLDQCLQSDIREITTTRVNSLIYFTYAWTLAEFNEELFPMEAWKHGAVAGGEVNRYIERFLSTRRVMFYDGCGDLIPAHVQEIATFVFENYMAYSDTSLITFATNEPAFVAVKARVRAGEGAVPFPAELTKSYYKTLLADDS